MDGKKAFLGRRRDRSIASVGTISETGLTRFEVATSHEGTADDSGGHALFADWLEVVLNITEPEPVAWKPQVIMI